MIAHLRFADLQKRYTLNHKRAILQAKKEKWFISKKYAKDRIVTLQGIDSFGIPIYYTSHNVVASVGTHTATLYSGGGLGVDLKGDLPQLSGRLCIWDGGLPRLSHVEFGGRVRQKDGNTLLSDHSTHLSGTMAAAGINPQVKGMAFGARLDVWDYTNDLVEMTQEASKILVSNHAYGPVVGWFYNESRPGNDPNRKWEWWGNTGISTKEDYRFGFYDEKARDLDQLAYNNPFYLIVKSADNKRAETGPPIGTPYFLRNTNQTSILDRYRNNAYDVIPADANAKNILTVGGADLTVKNGRLSGFSVADFSGWGPTDDGRIKPDLLGVGTNIISSISSTDNAYATLSGTSTACANVSGTLILLQELFYRKQNYFMRSATLKGLVLHTADKPLNKSGPSYEYGWGLLNAEKAAKVLINSEKTHVLAERSLRQNETYRQKIIATGNTPLVATLSWTDPAGTPSAVSAQTVDAPAIKLINDLDIRLSDDAGATWFPWVLDPANPAKDATPGDNIRDNTEQIIIASPTPGKVYTLTIRHKRTLQTGTQPYSLFISGVRPQDCNTAVQLVSGSDTTLCGNTSLKMEVKGDIALTYEWSKDGKLLTTTTAPLLTIMQKGIYSVKAIGYQCAAQSKPINVRVTDLTAQLSPTGSIAICSGRAIPLKANEGLGYRYQWKRNGVSISEATGSVLNPTEPGTYTVSISANNCTATSKPTQLLSALRQPVISTNSGTVIPPNGSIRLTTDTGEKMTYRWLLNDKVLPTATGARLAASLPGKYTVEITQNGCSLLSKPLVLTNVPYLPNTFTRALDILIVKENLKLFPNPAVHTLTVVYESADTYDLEARIITLTGVKLESKLLYDNGSVFLNQFDVSQLPPGTYFIQVSDGNRTISKPFVKQ
ncbi:S8 family serine peptidase [Runella slithyformis]|uniref:S8 family serine peptidase n=1 Tax=Runella slithyformis TaxID=106 RepID=UPI00031BE235|nr:S8 family serine peptidase [Runella slithyformis]